MSLILASFKQEGLANRANYSSNIYHVCIVVANSEMESFFLMCIACENTSKVGLFLS